MAKDYSRRRSARRTRSGGPKILSICFSFLLGYAAASFFDLDDLSQWFQEQFSSTESVAAPEANAAPQASSLPPKPKFEFYTLLTNEKVPKTAQAVANTASSAVAPTPTESVGVRESTPSKAGAYSVQVASFKVRSDAEQMKGALTLKGFNVSIVPINHPSRGNWFRVVVGPYANKVLAQKAQGELARNEHLHGMVTMG